MRSLRLLMFAAFLAFGPLVLGALAQSHEPAKPAAQPAATQPESKPESAHGKEKPAEGDEEAEFKESASVQWLAKVTGLSVSAAYWVSTVLNFVIIAAVLFLFLKSPMANFFRSRTEGIQKNREEARQTSEEARQRLSEIEARLSKLDAETAEMRSTAEREAGKEEAAARAAAEEARAKIVTGAEQEIAAAARAARGELKSYAAELAVSLAEKKIQVDAATDRALVQEFVGQLGKDGK